MRICTRFAPLVAALALMSGPVLAQSTDIEIGKIDFPKRVWGTQTMRFDIVNNSDVPKFLVVETDVSFEDSYAPARRQTSQNFILLPSATLACEPSVDIPGNYGKAIIRIVIHDVVDTLDDLSLGQKVFEQPFHLKFTPPETVLPYRQEKISLPPLVDRSAAVDNEFSRLLLVMLKEGKTPAEIAAITEADSAYVVRQMQFLVSKQYLISQDGQYLPSIPIILRPEADEVRALADRISDAMVQQIKTNWPAFDTVTARVLSNESKLGGNQGFMSGISVLRQPYVVVTGLFLWSRLGSRFINGTTALNIYQKTDLCQANIAQYSYLVQGGDYYNGHHYFDGQYAVGSEVLLFGDSVPVYSCAPGSKGKTVLPEYHPDSYQYDTTYTNPVLAVLETGMADIQNTAATALEEIHTRHGYATFAAGVKYWFWNLTATLVTDKLLKDGVLIRTGKGQYRYQRKAS